MPCLRRPGDAWWIVPAKYSEGTEALSQSAVCAGSLLRPTVATPSAARSRTGAVKPVAAMTSSASKTSSPDPSLRFVRTR
jgi:hypothetical protein